MPTEKQIAAQNKRDLISRVISAALTLLHESNMYGTVLWPKQGFVLGHGIGQPNNDTWYLGVNVFGIDQNPIIGRLGFNIHTRGKKRISNQIEQINLVLDQAFCEGIFFENEFNNITPTDLMWFKFTINK